MHGGSVLKIMKIKPAKRQLLYVKCLYNILGVSLWSPEKDFVLYPEPL